MTVLAIALLVTAPALAVSQVDFRLGHQADQRGGSIITGTAGSPLPLAPSAPGEDARSDRADRGDGSDYAPVGPRFFVAHGFGQNVPLSFAVRQVVPPRVRVSYGRGVDRQQPVSWTGGKPWDQVLRNAVRPLGLHVVMSHMAVHIVE